MSRVLIYTKRGCQFSEQALNFLDEKGIPYDEIESLVVKMLAEK